MGTIERVARDLNKFGVIPISCWDYGVCEGSTTPTYGGGVWFPLNDLPVREPIIYNPPMTTNAPTVISTPTQVTCNCFAGAAYIENGVCKCCDGVVIGNACTGGIKSPSTPTPAPTLPTPPTTTQTPAPQAPINAGGILDTLKANPIPVALGAVALVLLLGRK